VARKGTKKRRKAGSVGARRDRSPRNEGRPGAYVVWKRGEGKLIHQKVVSAG